MSLVNDVLRQVNEKDHSQKRMNATLPTSLQQDHHDRDHTKIFILSLTASILVVYVLQLFFMGSFNTENIQVNAPEFVHIENSEGSINKIDEPEVVEGSNYFSEKVSALPIKSDAAEPVAAELIVVEPIVVEPIVMTSKVEIPFDEPVKISPVPVKRVESIARKVEQPVISKAVSNLQDVQYQDALRQFIAGNVDKAERILKNIINDDVKEKYLELQARIYIKKGQSNDFYRLVNKYPGNSGLSWYKLIAPGLQLFSYYHLSNQYYDAIIKIEPNQIRWKLAMALNYSRLGEVNEAISIYSSLASSSYVSDRQKKWLVKKIKRLTLSKA